MIPEMKIVRYASGKVKEVTVNGVSLTSILAIRDIDIGTIGVFEGVDEVAIRVYAYVTVERLPREEAER